MKRPLLTTFAALLGAAAVAQADGVVYQTADTGVATAPAPVFVRSSNHFQGPRARSGVSIGFSTSTGRRTSGGVRISTGFSTSIGSRTRITTSRTVHTNGAIIQQRTVYPGRHYNNHHYGNTHVSTVHQDSDAQRRVGLRAESEARIKLQQVRAQIEAVGGALLEGGIRPAQVRWDGFNLQATSAVHATFVVPDSVLVHNGTPIARGRFELVIPKSGVQVPLAVNEVVRLVRNPGGESNTLLGALLRRAWTDARGKLTKTRGAQLRVVSPQGGVSQLEFASFDETLGRRSAVKRAFGSNYEDLPLVTSKQVSAHGQALKGAIQARGKGDARHYQALVTQRAGYFGGATQGLSSVNSR